MRALEFATRARARCFRSPGQESVVIRRLALGPATVGKWARMLRGVWTRSAGYAIVPEASAGEQRPADPASAHAAVTMELLRDAVITW